MSENAVGDDLATSTVQKGWRFWVTLFSIALTFFICAFEFTAVATILPTLTLNFLPVLDIWVILSYVLSATAAIPISAGLAQAIGRRWTFFISLGFFITGSGIASTWETIETVETLVASRAVLGFGAGGMQTVAAIMLNDLIPLEERSRYSPFFVLIFVIPYLIGPIVAAAFSDMWIFLINVPIAGFLLLSMIGFVKSSAPRPSSRGKVLARIDWIGNLLIVGGTASIVTGLVCGGAFFPWSSYQVIVPLVLGILGLLAFVPWEIYVAAEPILPASAFKNRTTISGYIQTFCVSLVTYAVIYFVPVYYGACIDATPIEIGTYMLGFGSIVPATAVAWSFIYLKKRYRPVIWFGWGFVVVGVALLAKAKTGESPDHVIGVSALIGVGLGFLFVSIIHAVQAPLSATQSAQGLGFLVYLRTLSGVWGIAIATAILQNKVPPRLPSDIWDITWHRQAGYAYGYSAVVPRIPDGQDHSQIQAAYKDSLQSVWMAIGTMAALGLVSSLVMQAVPLPEYTQGGWMMMQSGGDREETEELIERRHEP